MSVDTRECPRCNGSGQYSFNLMYGRVCFKCGGSGRVLATSKGQSQVKPTADIAVAREGDIVARNKVLYRVDKIIWVRHAQRVRLIRLVDQKAFIHTRYAFDSRFYGIDPSADLIGKSVDETSYACQCRQCMRTVTSLTPSKILAAQHMSFLGWLREGRDEYQRYIWLCRECKERMG